MLAAWLFSLKRAVYTPLQGIAHKKRTVSAELQGFFPVWESERLPICVMVAGTPDFSEFADDSDILELVWRKPGVHAPTLASFFLFRYDRGQKNEKVHNVLSCLLIVVF
jgi:hypothetical protein